MIHDITPIKVVNTRTKTAEEMDEFTAATNELLRVRNITLINDID